MDRDYKETKENFKVDCMLDFFNEHFEQIDAYIKWELYKFAKDQEKDLFYNNEIYKKIKSDRICILYSYLYSYFLDDIPSKKHEIIEEEREKYLKNYIESFKEENEKEIIEICKLMDIYEDELYSYYFNISIFLYNIGRRYKNATKLYEKTNNIYILLGLYDKEDFKININNDEQVKKILKYSSLDKNLFSERLFKQIVNYYNIGNSYIVDNYICKIIFSNKKIFNTQEYMDKAINIVRFYNKKIRHANLCHGVKFLILFCPVNVNIAILPVSSPPGIRICCYITMPASAASACACRAVFDILNNINRCFKRY